MVCKPASSISAMNDEAFQVIAMQIAQKASVGSESHCGGSIPKAASQSFTTPVLYSKNQRKMRPANTSGNAQGRSKPSRTGHFTLKGLLASKASPSPTSSAPGTVTTTYSTVFSVEFQKRSSTKALV